MRVLKKKDSIICAILFLITQSILVIQEKTGFILWKMKFIESNVNRFFQNNL